VRLWIHVIRPSGSMNSDAFRLSIGRPHVANAGGLTLFNHGARFAQGSWPIRGKVAGRIRGAWAAEEPTVLRRMFGTRCTPLPRCWETMRPDEAFQPAKKLYREITICLGRIDEGTVAEVPMDDRDGLASLFLSGWGLAGPPLMTDFFAQAPVCAKSSSCEPIRWLAPCALFSSSCRAAKEARRSYRVWQDLHLHHQVGDSRTSRVQALADQPGRADPQVGYMFCRLLGRGNMDFSGPAPISRPLMSHHLVETDERA